MDDHEGLDVILARMSRAMGRSDEVLLRSISHYEGADMRSEARPMSFPQIAAIRAGPIVGPCAMASAR
jgi:hypothetical protein